MTDAAEPVTADAQDTIVPLRERVDLARPMTGNLPLIKQLIALTWQLMRHKDPTAPVPHPIAKWIGLLWIPLELAAIISIAFLGEPTELLPQMLAIAYAPRLALKLLVFAHVLKPAFIGSKGMTATVIAIDSAVLGALIISGWFHAQLLWLAPVLTLFFVWRLRRRAGSATAALRSLIDSLEAAQVSTSDGAPTPKPKTRVRMTSASEVAARDAAAANDPKDEREAD